MRQRLSLIAASSSSNRPTLSFFVTQRLETQIRQRHPLQSQSRPV
jgi:hypothetical protein